MWTRMADNTKLAIMAHDIAEMVTVALGELYLARQSAASGPELAGAVERAELALRRVKEPMQRLTTELATELKVKGAQCG